MSVEYTYSKAAVNLDKLTVEIEDDETITKTLEYMNDNNGASDNLHIFFNEALPSGEETALDTLVSNHDGQPMTVFTRYCKCCGCYFSIPAISAPTACVRCSSSNIVASGFKIPAKSIMLLGDGTGLSGSQTGYLAPWGAFSVEDSAQIRMPACIIKRLTIYISSNTVGGDTVYTIRKNSVATSLTLTFGNSATGRQTIAENVEFADGDLLSLQTVIGGTPAHGIYYKEASVEVEV